MHTVFVQKQYARMALVTLLRGLWPGVALSPLAPTRWATIVPDPPLPGPRWVRVQNRLAGICGSDLHLLRVDASLAVSAAALPGTDRIYLGHEVVGVVSEVGPAVTRVAPGSRVIMDFEAANCLSREIEPPCRHCQAGNHLLCENTSVQQGAEAIGGGWGDTFIAHETGVYPLPAALSDEQGLMIEPLAVGVRAVLRRVPGRGERALVVGAGTIGLGALMALRAFAPDCTVAVLARYPHQAALAQRLGADEVWQREDPYVATASLTGARLYQGAFGNRTLLGGFDVIYDCVGSGRSIGDSLRWARAGGAVVLVGAAFRPLHVDLTPVWHQEVDLVGLYGHGSETWRGETCSTYDLTRDLLLAGRLTVDGLITHRFPLREWKRAVRTALDKASGAVKVVLECAPPTA